MINPVLINNPLEQFEIISYIPLNFLSIDLSFTNAAFFMVVALACFIQGVLSLKLQGNGFIIPGRYQSIFEGVHETLLGMTNSVIVGDKGQQYFPFIFILFTFIMVCNLIGMIPYTFTLASHMIITVFFALMVFIGVNIICFKEYGLKMFALFLPPGTPIALVPMLILIELVSYIFRPISLSVRLFANMMSGHVLLKVIAGFAWTMMTLNGLIFIAHIFPLMVLVLLIGLELGVAMVQAYVFTMLTCMYINDALNLH